MVFGFVFPESHVGKVEYLVLYQSPKDRDMDPFTIAASVVRVSNAIPASMVWRVLTLL